jgi:hypothetical protein
MLGGMRGQVNESQGVSRIARGRWHNIAITLSTPDWAVLSRSWCNRLITAIAIRCRVTAVILLVITVGVYGRVMSEGYRLSRAQKLLQTVGQVPG